MDYLTRSDDVAERAQVLLVTTFGIAALFVLLTLVLNASAFTNTMATRDDAGRDGIQFRAAAVDGVGGSVQYVNEHNDTDYATLDTELAESVSDWNEQANGYAVRRGERVAVTVLDTTHASRLHQDNASRAMTSAGDAADWTLATGVTEIRSGTFTVDANSLGTPVDDSKTSDLHNASAFHVVVDGTDTWELFVYRKGGEVRLAVDDENGVFQTCAVSGGGDVTIDLVNATVDGTSCNVLSGFDDAGSSYSVAYRNGDNAVGTYALFVDEQAVTSNFGTAANGEPYVDPSIDTVSIRVSVATSQTTYTTETTIEAGDLDG